VSKGLRIVIALVLCAVVALPLIALVRAICQHRATYPGGLVFIGEAQGPFGTRYHRVFLWKPPAYTEPLPSVTVYLDAKAYPLSSLTQEIVTSYGGTRMHGNLLDSRGSTMRYRFENGKLTWFSLEAPDPRFASRSQTSPHVDELAMSLGNGPPFSLPQSHAQLVQACGRALDTSWNLAN